MPNTHANTTSGSSRRVLIRTLPLTVGNYGGILQAYALQQVIQGLGHEAVVDTPTRYPITWKTAPSFVKNALVKQTAYPSFLPSERNARIKNITSFVESRMTTTEVTHGFVPRLDRDVVSSFDTFVAGSDQVWRPLYTDVLSNMFDFVTAPDARLLSYAASFGRSDLTEFSRDDLARASELLGRFAAVSVRERNAVRLVSELGARAEFVLDPTLLAGVSLFEPLVEGDGGSGDEVLVLMLDESESRRGLVDEVVRSVGGRAGYLYPPELESRRLFRDSPEKYVLPRVETWITRIANARCVITDSYHATLFSVLFHKDFVTVGNSSRGLDRFSSILGELGLEGRLVDEAHAVLPGGEPIDWTEVDRSLQKLRQHSLGFLRSALGAL